MTHNLAQSRPKGTARQVYDGLRTRILEASLPPGEDLDEATLVEMYGVSRTPVREALIRLASEGLVELLPHRGARVAALNFTDIPQYFESLDLLQRAATRWAASRRSDEDLKEIDRARKSFERRARQEDTLAMTEANHDFHAAIGRASGNDYIARAYLRLLDEGLRVARLSYAHEVPESEGRIKHIDITIDDHRLLQEYIAARDADRAEALAGEHTERFRQRIITFFSQTLAPEVAITIKN